MPRRYSDIKRAAKLSAALTAYQAYLAKPPSPTLGAYTPRPNPKALMVTPFGLTLPTDTLALVSANEPSFTRLGSVIGTKGGVAEATEKASLIVGFSPARVVTFENATKSATSATSKITNQAYRKYAGDRFSCPFGQKATGDKEIDVGNQIKSALRARPSLEVNRVSLTPERQRAR